MFLSISECAPISTSPNPIVLQISRSSLKTTHRSFQCYDVANNVGQFYIYHSSLSLADSKTKERSLFRLSKKSLIISKEMIITDTLASQVVRIFREP